MSKAFTIIEVVISVVIIVSVGIGLLQVSSNSTKLISYSQKKALLSGTFSVALLNKNNVCEDKDTNLYEPLKTTFDIKDDKLITILKEQTFSCKQEEDKNIDLNEEEKIDKNFQTNLIINKISLSQKSVGNIIGYKLKER